jgi:hypothetical protein
MKTSNTHPTLVYLRSMHSNGDGWRKSVPFLFANRKLTKDNNKTIDE